jgi:hypothetical protein
MEKVFDSRPQGMRITRLEGMVKIRSIPGVELKPDQTDLIKLQVSEVNELIFGQPHNWTKINSFTSDTCNLMKELSPFSGTKTQLWPH